MAGFLMVHLLVSHVTGFAGHSAVLIEQGSYDKALIFLFVPVCFLIGSFVSGVFISVRRARDQKPAYFEVMSLLGVIYLLLGIFGQMSFLGEFGAPFAGFGDFVLLSGLCFNCGAQNALFTHYSNSIIRTTHLTGLTTDLGIGLAKRLLLNGSGEKKYNTVRIELISSFLAGSIFAAFLLMDVHFAGLYFPAAVSFFIAFRLNGKT